MELVHKKISLEPFRSRQKSTIPFSGMDSGTTYDNLNWGQLAYGVNFNDENYWIYDEESDSMVRVPSLYELSGETAVHLYGEGIRELGAFNFTELMDAYHAVKNDREYVESLTDEELKKIKSIVSFVESKKIIDQPDVVPDPCCEPCATPTFPEEYDMDDGEYYIPSFANVNICLVQNANIVGSYTFATKDWKEGKRYFPGDKVIYDGRTYKLKDFENVNARINGSAINCMGEPAMPNVGFYTANTLSEFSEYDSAYDGLSEMIFNEFIVKDESEIVDMGYIYAKKEIGNSGENIYYIRPSWGGFKNEYDGAIYFDTLKYPKQPEMGFDMPTEYDTVHWELAKDVISYGEYAVSGCVTDVHIAGNQPRDIGFDDVTMTGLTWESKLVNFIRNTKTVDVHGQTLPGKIGSITGSTIIDLDYLIGTIKNIDTSGEVPIGDYLADITVIPDHHTKIRMYFEKENWSINQGMAKWEERDPDTGEIIDSGYDSYDYTSYTYSLDTIIETPNMNDSGWFIGSIEKSGDVVKIYTKDSLLLWVSSGDSGAIITTGIQDSNYTIQVAIGSDEDNNEIIKYEKDDRTGETEHHVTVKVERDRKKAYIEGKTEPYYSWDMSDGKYSFNGEGFRIQPTGGTEDQHNIIADKILDEYRESGDTGDTNYVLFQTLNTYEKLVENWAGEGKDNETGMIYFKYYVGAELEKEKNEQGEVMKDADYIYNGGERRLIYEDAYRFTARALEVDIETPDGEINTGVTYVYLDIDYNSATEDVILENIDYYKTSSRMANVTATTQSMTDGGEPWSVNFQNADYFMEDYQLGISFVANNNENVYIDRGSATAFERHLRLSEVDTMEDLEIMGNGSFFRMKE